MGPRTRARWLTQAIARVVDKLAIQHIDSRSELLIPLSVCPVVMPGCCLPGHTRSRTLEVAALCGGSQIVGLLKPSVRKCIRRKVCGSSRVAGHDAVAVGDQDALALGVIDDALDEGIAGGSDAQGSPSSATLSSAPAHRLYCGMNFRRPFSTSFGRS